MQRRLTKTPGSIVEAIRRVYLDEPWTSAAGLARRFGVTLKESLVAIVGGWEGRHELNPVLSDNLAAYREAHRDELERRLGGQGRVRIEPKVAAMKTQAAVVRSLAKKEKCCRHCRANRSRLRYAASQRAQYKPLVGASALAGAQKRKERRSDGKREAAAAAPPSEPTP